MGLIGVKNPRPTINDQEVRNVWAHNIYNIFKSEVSTHDLGNFTRTVQSFCDIAQDLDAQDNFMNFVAFIREDNDRFTSFSLNWDNRKASHYIDLFNGLFTRAYRSCVSAWVMLEGIRFPAKEGDAIEIFDPETKFPKTASVQYVDETQARGYVTYRDKNDKTSFAYINAEDVIKVYKEGKPTPPTPRGGSIRQASYEDTNAYAKVA